MARSLDEDLFSALRQVNPYFDEVDWLRDHVRIGYEERESFLNNEIENPLFTYRDQTPDPGYVDRLESFHFSLQSSAAPAVVIDLYRRKLDKQLLRNAMITASLNGDDEAFYRASCEQYGKPKKELFSYVAKRLLTICDKKKPLHPGSARRLRKVVAKIDHNLANVDRGVLPPPVLNGKAIRSVAEVESIFRATLDRCGIVGWSVYVDETGTLSRFSVKPQRRIIYIPSEQQLLSRPKPLTDVSVQGLAEHEIGVHVRRTYEAMSSPLRLLEIGFDNYLVGEEGLGGYVQQQIEGSDEFYGFDRYLAASLAVGMDGEVRDFRAVFSLMVDYYTLTLAPEETTEVAPSRAAWDVCLRIFRGTTGQTAGCIFTKDIVYLEGNIGIWNLLIDKPHVFESLFLGKFNPLLPRHVQTLQTLGIMAEW